MYDSAVETKLRYDVAAGGIRPEKKIDGVEMKPEKIKLMDLRAN